MKLRTPLLMLATFTAACADDAIAPERAEFAELCGQAGPVQILALDPDRPLAGVGDQGTFGERRIVRVDYAGGEPVSDVFPAIGDSELWSVGPCGEDPLLLFGQGDHRLSGHPELWPDVLLECDMATGRISTFDPLGVRPANVVFETGDCSTRTLDEGLLTIVANDDATASLVLQAWPDDPWTESAESVVLHDSLRTPIDLDIAGSVVVTDEEILVIAANDELVAISRLDGELTTITTDVHAFDNDSIGRYVVWQDTEVTNGDPHLPEGTISLLDRQTDEVTQLVDSAALKQTVWSPFVLESMDILHLWIESSQVERFYRLPTLESFDLSTLASPVVFQPVDDTHALIADWGSEQGPYWLFDTVDGELTTLFDGVGSLRQVEDAMYVLENVECCTPANSNRKAGKLWRLSYAGEPELLARRATLGYQLIGDGRVITPIDVDTDFVGELIVVDPVTLDERLIDDHVLRFQPSARTEIEGDPIVFYGVADRERRGVWLARLPHEE